MCLALTVFFEARGEPEIGQIAVAEVVVNRAEAKNTSICSVIKEKGQFSWVSRWNGNMPTGAAWEKSVTIAQATLNGRTTNYTKGALYFRHKSIKGKVAYPIVIGNHVFYRDFVTGFTKS